MVAKKFIKSVLTAVVDGFNNQKIKRSVKNEYKKFKDPRRVSIYSKIIFNKEQKDKIDKFFLENYGKKIPYTWHRHYTAFTGNFDEKYMPEFLYIPKFERFMNQNLQYAKFLTDKNALSVFAKGAGVKMPEELIKCSKGFITDDQFNPLTFEKACEYLSNAGETFIKPTVESSSGQGCILANFIDSVDQLSGKTVKEILTSLPDNFTVQKRLICHESLRKIYSNSVNTFRVITYRFRDNIEVCPLIMRIGQGGSHLDNAHAGGMFIAVDDDGTLHKTAFTEFKNEFTVHPNTNLVFEGYKIPFVDKVIESAKKLHSSIPQIGVSNWDFTIDDKGEPVLIEANVYDGKTGGSVWLPQMAHGKGAFKENTAEILKWIAKLEKLPNKKRLERPFCKT